MTTAAAMLLCVGLHASGAAPAGTVVQPQDVSPLFSRAKLELSRPLRFHPAAVHPNQAMEYNLALVGPANVLEVRYAVRFAAQERDVTRSAPASESGKSARRVVVSAANLFPALVRAIILNISGGDLPEIQRFEANAALREFGADEGLTAVFVPTAAGWTAHKRCMLVALRKAGASEAYVFFLFDDFERADTHIQAAFHSLRFAP